MNKCCVPIVWNDFRARFGGPEFADAVLRKFGRKFEDGDFVTTQLVRDELGYGIGPHTDIVSKKLTVLFYLPVDNSLLQFGTSICRTGDKSLIGNSDHHHWDRFDESHVVLFRPNTAMAFCRTDDSFHAVRTIVQPIIRHSIAVTVRIQ